MNLKPFTAFALLLTLSGTASADTSQHHTSAKPVPPKTVLQKKAAVKLYPNPSTTGRVRVVSQTPGMLNFYIFGVDGTLLHQAVLNENEKHTITNLKKGVYTYDAFYNDEGIEHGKLIVK
jgi:hypothetical protein